MPSCFLLAASEANTQQIWPVCPHKNVQFINRSQFNWTRGIEWPSVRMKSAIHRIIAFGDFSSIYLPKLLAQKKSWDFEAAKLLTRETNEFSNSNCGLQASWRVQVNIGEALKATWQATQKPYWDAQSSKRPHLKGLVAASRQGLVAEGRHGLCLATLQIIFQEKCKMAWLMQTEAGQRDRFLGFYV